LLALEIGDISDCAYSTTYTVKCLLKQRAKRKEGRKEEERSQLSSRANIAGRKTPRVLLCSSYIPCQTHRECEATEAWGRIPRAGKRK